MSEKPGSNEGENLDLPPIPDEIRQILKNPQAAKKLLGSLEEIVLPFGQWQLIITPDKYTIVNPGPNGEKRFYQVTPGKYGEPLITAEPDKAFAPPTNLRYVDGKGQTTTPNEKIAGIVCKDGPRFSLSSPQAPEFVISPEGDLIIGETRYALNALYKKDDRRITNYDAYFSKVKPAEVRVLELGDLDLYSKSESSAAQTAPVTTFIPAAPQPVTPPVQQQENPQDPGLFERVENWFKELAKKIRNLF